jgi:hypothetical protein
VILVNFAHPITAEQRARAEELTGRAIVEIRDAPTQFDNERPFAEQVAAQLDRVGLSAAAWQQEVILINPPGFAPVAAVLIAELHGRMGYFPAILRLRPIAGALPPQFEIAEIINLQAVRDAARANGRQQ